MHVEIAVPRTESNKVKGDLLETLACEFLQTQNYSVETQVRCTASELDLLCRHKVTTSLVYVECKAHREPLSSNVLKNLLGTIDFHDYEEGWLVSAGPLGKDAKGLQFEWERKDTAKRRRLSIYDPSRTIQSLINARIIIDPNTINSESAGQTRSNSWTLLVSPYGRFWLQPILISGAPEAVSVFLAGTGEQVTDQQLLRRLSNTDSSFSNLDFEAGVSSSWRDLLSKEETRRQEVVEVQQGESWSDYRPARPADFVGRKIAQDSIIQFLENVRHRRTTTRVFAVTGDTGMGKSSLIAKLRSRSQNRRNRKKFFIYAVDVRAATRPSYVISSLIFCLDAAQKDNFIKVRSTKIEINNPSDPLDSTSVQDLLNQLEKSNRVVCLIFDQFEELYSKPELFPIFEEAQRLFLSAAAASSNVVLGFAWRSDSTVQQDHPAYYMWHRLSDHRMEISLGPFSHAEASKAITIFERELGQPLLPGLRRQLVENSQGYPWLLKKLCIHLYRHLQGGGKQAHLLDAFNVASLFEDDLKMLNAAEKSALWLIAEKAPADWHEMLDTAGAEVLRALQDKRLVIRSGDRVNLYWDIFREFILTGRAPYIPFTYVPSAPSLEALLAVAEQLDHNVARKYDELSKSAELQPSTVQNVIHDLVMLGVAREVDGSSTLDNEMESANKHEILKSIRAVLKRHALYLELKEREEVKDFLIEDIVAGLKKVNPAATHRARTWRVYAERMAKWLHAAGLIQPVGRGWLVHDVGKPIHPTGTRRRSPGGRVHSKPFQGDAPPHRVVEALGWLVDKGPCSKRDMKKEGFRNAVSILVRFGIGERNEDGLVEAKRGGDGSPIRRVWAAARSEESIEWACKKLKEHREMGGATLGKALAEEYGESWTSSSCSRIGNGLRKWAVWLLEAEKSRDIPTPGANREGDSVPQEQGFLFRKGED